MDNKINQQIDEVIDRICELVWNREIDLDELAQKRPSFYQYLIDSGILYLPEE